MRMSRGIVWCLVLLLVSIQTLSAQLDRLPSRGELDSLVRPKLSTVANRAISAKRATIDLGEIDDTKSIKAEFTLRNTTSSIVTITQFRSMCSCLKVLTRPATLRPNESLTIEVEFSPKGRNGKFSQEVLVYTSLDQKYPTERLTLQGTISPASPFPHLSQRIGELYLSRTTVTLDGVKPGSTRRESIAVANASKQSITLSAKPLISGLEFSVTPTTLEPGGEGKIVISYTPGQAINSDIETLIIIEGCSGKPSQRVIKVTIKQ